MLALKTEEPKAMVESVETTTQPATPETKAETQTASPDTEQLIFTVRAITGEVVNIEKVDKTGVRGDLSEEESRRMASEDDADKIESAIDASFEAGYLEALEDADILERLILLRLLERPSGGTRILPRPMMRRLLLRRLMRAGKVPR